jgi:hypothetical protein
MIVRHFPLWLRLSSGMLIPVGGGAEALLDHGTDVAPLSDSRCAALDLAGTRTSSANAFYRPHRISVEKTVPFLFFFWSEMTWPRQVSHKPLSSAGALFKCMNTDCRSPLKRNLAEKRCIAFSWKYGRSYSTLTICTAPLFFVYGDIWRGSDEVRLAAIKWRS